MNLRAPKKLKFIEFRQHQKNKNEWNMSSHVTQLTVINFFDWTIPTRSYFCQNFYFLEKYELSGFHHMLSKALDNLRKLVKILRLP